MLFINIKLIQKIKRDLSDITTGLNNTFTFSLIVKILECFEINNASSILLNFLPSFTIPNKSV